MDGTLSQKDLYNMLFQQRLKTLRKEQKLTQADLAAKLNIARSSISSYENGDRYPDPSNMEKLCTFFGVDEDYLSGYSEFRQSPSLKKFVIDSKYNINALAEITGLKVSEIVAIENRTMEPDPSDNYFYIGERMYSGIIDLMMATDQDMMAVLVNILYLKNDNAIKLLKEYMISLEALLNKTSYFEDPEDNISKEGE